VIIDGVAENAVLLAGPESLPLVIRNIFSIS